MKKINSKEVLAWARKVLETEQKGIDALGKSLGKGFLDAVKIMAACRGRVVVTGMLALWASSLTSGAQLLMIAPPPTYSTGRWAACGRARNSTSSR